MVPHCDASALLGICCNQCHCKRRHLLDHLVYTVCLPAFISVNPLTLYQIISHPYDDAHLDLPRLPTSSRCTIRSQLNRRPTRCCSSRPDQFDRHCFRCSVRPRDWLSGQLDDIFCVYLPSYDAEVATRDHETWNGRQIKSQEYQ